MNLDAVEPPNMVEYINPPPVRKTAASWNLAGGNVFSFLEAVRNHKSPRNVENLRTELSCKHEIKYTCADALRFAIMYGHVSYAEHLLKTDVEAALARHICCPLLLLAVRLNSPASVDVLCRYSRLRRPHLHYVDVRGCSTMECGRSALHTAAETGNVDCTRILLRYGADVHALDDSGCTPLVRLLYKMQQVHINCKVVQCALELLRCESQLHPSHAHALQRLVEHASYAGNIPTPGPFLLSEICRSTIRRCIGYPRLPEALGLLDLPKSIQTFLDVDL